MATATAILNEKYKSKDGTYPIVIRLIDGRRQKLHPIKYKIPKHYWQAGQVRDIHPEADIINSVIDEELLRAKRYFRDCRLQNIHIDLELVFQAVKSHSFTEYLRHRARQHKEAGQVEMHFKANRYQKEFVKCFGREVYFSELTQDALRTFDAWLMREDPEQKKKANSANTRAKKYEFLGKYYNNAVREGKAMDPNPFYEFKKTVKTTPVKKQKLTREEISSIENLPLKDGKVRLARDLFLFSYYCKGARFETCLLMKKDALQNGRLYFQTNKGKKHLSVELHPKLKAIIEHYIDNPTDTIFGRVMSDLGNQKRSKVGSENFMVNRELKVVAQLAEVPIALSMHHARHTLAFHLKKNKADIHAIKQALGHSRTQTTEIYLTDLDDEAIDPVMRSLYQ